jgi:D-alanyl-D-alanine carboxypeptidase
MRRKRVGASRALRWGCFGLAFVVGLLAIATDPADARSRRKRAVKKQHHAQSYNPPYAAIIVDARTGATLHQASPDALRHPASLTKIMTLYLLFEQMEAGRIRAGTPLEVSAEAASQAPTKLGLRPGQTLMVEDAIKGLVTKSANDAAVVVAEALAGSEEEFARQMTRKARALGMSHTVYRNASGLPDDEQVTTARDQALLGIAIQERFPRYYRYFSTPSFVYRGHAMRNHNRLLGQVDGVDGIKTGYTRASGFNLVTSVRRGERHIVGVVLGGRSGGQRDARMRDLIQGNIMLASTRPAATTRVAEAPAPLPFPFPLPLPFLNPKPAETPEPAAQPQLASAESTPFALDPPQTGEATAAIPSNAGSSAPIKPIPVRTYSVKLVPSKHAALRPEPAQIEHAKIEHAKIEHAKIEHAKIEHARIEPDRTEPARTEAVKTVPAPTARAAQKQPAKSDEAAPRSHSVRGGWVIQVGAFEAESEAKERLSSAQSKAARLLGKASRYTERTTKGEKTYYRARFAGFDRDQAQAACRQLKRSEIDCMALKI